MKVGNVKTHLDGLDFFDDYYKNMVGFVVDRVLAVLAVLAVVRVVVVMGVPVILVVVV